MGGPRPATCRPRLSPPENLEVAHEHGHERRRLGPARSPDARPESPAAHRRGLLAAAWRSRPGTPADRHVGRPRRGARHAFRFSYSILVTSVPARAWWD